MEGNYFSAFLDTIKNSRLNQLTAVLTFHRPGRQATISSYFPYISRAIFDNFHIKKPAEISADCFNLFT